MGKFVGAGLGARMSGHTPREAVVIGYGMNGRGAVELVVAAVVIKLSNELLTSGVITEPLLTQPNFATLINYCVYNQAVIRFRPVVLALRIFLGPKFFLTSLPGERCNLSAS